MDSVFRLQSVEFEWSLEHTEENVRKHGVTFEEAAEAFLDPFYQMGDATTGPEPRAFLLGYSLSARLLLVVHVSRGERLRIVSARIATRAERKAYEQG